MMRSRSDSEHTLIWRILPSSNPCPDDRAKAWEDWQMGFGGAALRRYIRVRNYSTEMDEDIFQESVTTAFVEVERGRYRPRPGVPFTAYVKGIARNKIREARRRNQKWSWVALEDVEFSLSDTRAQQPEVAYERAQRRSHLYDGMSSLTAGHRQVLERVIRGERTSEIADALEISEDLVRQHKSRGLRRLKKMVLQEVEIR